MKFNLALVLDYRYNLSVNEDLECLKKKKLSCSMIFLENIWRRMNGLNLFVKENGNLPSNND